MISSKSGLLRGELFEGLSTRNYFSRLEPTSNLMKPFYNKMILKIAMC